MKRAGAAVLAVAVTAVLVVAWSRLGADFWPPDRSYIAPNLLAGVIQWAVIVIVAVLLWPPTRRRLHAFADRKADAIKAHIDQRHQSLHDRLDQLEARHDQHADALERIEAQISHRNDRADTVTDSRRQ